MLRPGHARNPRSRREGKAHVQFDQNVQFRPRFRHDFSAARCLQARRRSPHQTGSPGLQLHGFRLRSDGNRKNLHHGRAGRNPGVLGKRSQRRNHPQIFERPFRRSQDVRRYRMGRQGLFLRALQRGDFRFAFRPRRSDEIEVKLM